MTRRRSREAETEDVVPRRLKRGAVKTQHIDDWAVTGPKIRPGQIGDTHLHPTAIERIREVAAEGTAGQMLVLTATGVSITDGAAVVFDTILERHGFHSTTSPGASWLMPIEAVGLLTVELAWDTFEGGGLVELIIDGAVPPAGVVASGTSGQRGRGTIPFHAPEAAACALRVTHGQAGAQTADVTVRVAISDPATDSAGPAPEWVQEFTGDVWGLVHDGTNWWTTEGSPGLTVSKRDDTGAEVSSFEATDVVAGAIEAVRGITVAGSDLWLIGAAEKAFRYTTGGVLAASFDLAASWPAEATQCGIAFDGTDLWIVGDDTNELRRYSTAGALEATINLGDGRWRGVTFYDGDLWVMERDGTIYRYSTAGVLQSTVDATGAAAVLEGIWIAADGTLYVARDGVGVYRRIELLP